ncbi:hypothetical protein WN943_001910 [Citrus x changshan-huyou]
MVVVESASQDSVVSSAGSISASNGQDHPKQNGGTMVMSLDQGLYNQNNQRSNGGGDFKRDMRELQELCGISLKFDWTRKDLGLKPRFRLDWLCCLSWL